MSMISLRLKKLEISWLALLVFVTLAMYPTVAAGQGILARSKAESLAGLKGVHVSIEHLPPVAVEAGIKAEDIKSAAEAKLASRGVPVLGLGALTMDPRAPTLLIRVDMELGEPVYFYNVQIQFFQNVSMLTGGSTLASGASASTWQRSEFGRMGKFRIDGFPNEVSKLVDAFATDYLNHNTADQQTRAVGESVEPDVEYVERVGGDQ